MTTDFFEKFKQAEYEFTYGHEDDPENHNCLQVGLVAYFYIDQGYTDEKRQAMVDVMELYHQHFGDKLKIYYYDNPNVTLKYNDTKFNELKDTIIKEDGDYISLWATSESNLNYVSDYRFQLHSPADWFEQIHKRVSCIGFYLPISELERKELLEFLLIDFCQKLQPIHGLFGLGIQQVYECENYQYLEYEIAQEFLALDITVNGAVDKQFRNGIRSINWYSFFNQDYLAKLGGKPSLEDKLDDSRIQLIPYVGGMIVKAGDWPELGWVKDEPYPELYVKVNHALKPIRAPEIGSLGFGSIYGERRFDEKSTAQWLARFDVNVPSKTQANAHAPRQHLTAQTGEQAGFIGQWAATANGFTQYIQTQSPHETMPEHEDGKGRKETVTWTLLSREDGGSVYRD